MLAAGGLAALAIIPARAQTVTAVSNAASYATRVAPNMLMNVWGTGFTGGATNTAPYVLNPATGQVTLPTTLGNTQVTLDGTAKLGLLYTSDQQINVLLPETVQPGQHKLSVLLNGKAGNTYAFTINETAPGLFTYLNGAVTAQNNTTWQLYGPAGTGTVAQQNDWIVLYGAGFGASEPDGQGNQVVPNTAAYLQNSDGSWTGLTTLGTYVTWGFDGLYQTDAQLNTPLSTGMTPIVVCSTDNQGTVACSQPTLLPTWDGKSRYVNASLFDVDNNNALVAQDPLTITNTRTGASVTVTPAGGMYLGNAPSANAGDTLAAKITSTAYYNWTRNITAGSTTSLIPAAIPMLERFTDTDVDPSPPSGGLNNGAPYVVSIDGVHDDSLGDIFRMNGVSYTQTLCGKPFFYAFRPPLPMDFYIPGIGTTTPDVQAWLVTFPSLMEQGSGFTPGSMLQYTTQDPLVTGRDGIKLVFTQTSVDSIILKQDPCSGTQQGEFDAGTPTTIDIAEDAQAMVNTGDHEVFGHLGGYGYGGIHSTVPIHNMSPGVGGPPTTFEH
jgi:uncharacterized protein (TIGR03437 family)